MKTHLKNIQIDFNDAKNSRSLQTLKDLIEAAEKIVEEGEVEYFSARKLANISGYSLGSLIQRLGKIENIFLYAINTQRDRLIREIGEELEKMDVQEDITGLVNHAVAIGIDKLKSVSPRIMRYYEKRATLKAINTSDIFSYHEEFAPYLKRIFSKNQSNTIRHFSDDELRYLSRSIFLFLERPFAEGDPIAGSPEHRSMAVNALLGIMKV